jgi:hypothetical protein
VKFSCSNWPSDIVVCRSLINFIALFNRHRHVKRSGTGKILEPQFVLHFQALAWTIIHHVNSTVFPWSFTEVFDFGHHWPPFILNFTTLPIKSSITVFCVSILLELFLCSFQNHRLCSLIRCTAIFIIQG